MEEPGNVTPNSDLVEITFQRCRPRALDRMNWQKS